MSILLSEPAEVTAQQESYRTLTGNPPAWLLTASRRILPELAMATSRTCGAHVIGLLPVATDAMGALLAIVVQTVECRPSPV